MKEAVRSPLFRRVDLDHLPSQIGPLHLDSPFATSPRQEQINLNDAHRLVSPGAFFLCVNVILEIRRV